MKVWYNIIRKKEQPQEKGNKTMYTITFIKLNQITHNYENATAQCATEEEAIRFVEEPLWEQCANPIYWNAQIMVKKPMEGSYHRTV